MVLVKFLGIIGNMVENPTLVKTEYITEDDDIDCFGNFDHREKLTCLKCGMKTECEIITTKMKKENDAAKLLLDKSIGNTKKKLGDSKEVVKLVSKLKTKQKELEKNMSKEDKKLKKVKKVVKVKPVSEESSEKKEVKSSKEDKKVKKVKSKKTEISTIGETTLPKAFKTLHDGLKSFGEVVCKKSVTNVKSDNGILFCVPVTGRTEDKVELFLNRSRGYTFKSLKNVEYKVAKKGNTETGEAMLVVKSDDKSQSEALECLKKWAKDAPNHVKASSGKRGRPVSDKSEEKSEKKVKKVVKSEDSTDEKKVVKKASPPIIRPSSEKKVAPKLKVSDDEE